MTSLDHLNDDFLDLLKCLCHEGAELHGDSVHFIGKEALIVNKRATGRTKDLADVERLES